MPVPRKYLERLPFYFSHIDQDDIEGLKLPDYAAFSVSSFDDAFENAYLMKSLFPHITAAVDFTACAGVDTIALGFFFERVTAYEVNEAAFASLERHTELCTERFKEECVYTLIQGSGMQQAACENTVLVIDPEWGGPDYKKEKTLRLKYGDVYVDDFLKEFLDKSEGSVALMKLPRNYDVSYIRSVFRDFTVYVRNAGNQLFIILSKRAFHVDALFFDIALCDKQAFSSVLRSIQSNIGRRKGLSEAFTQRNWVREIDDLSSYLERYKRFAQNGYSGNLWGRFGVVTGFMILDTKYGPSSETDGPPGSVRLIITLVLNYNCIVTCFTEPGCVFAIKALFECVDAHFPFLNLSKRVEIKSKQDDDLKQVFDQQQMLFFIEKVGRNAEGIPLSMRGVDCSEHVTALYEDFTCRSVGVGDGGNEIGCGDIAFPGVENIHCVTKTDFTMLADVSNYGAALLARALNYRSFGLFIQRRLSEALLLESCCNAGSVDGVSAERTPTVDGLDSKTYCETIDRIFR